MKTTLFALSFLTMSLAHSQELDSFDPVAGENLGKMDRLERLEKQVASLTKEVLPLKKVAKSGSASSSQTTGGIVSSAELEKLTKQVADLGIKFEELRNNEIRPLRTTLDRLNSLSTVIESDVARIRTVEIETLKSDIATLALQVKKIEEQFNEAFPEEGTPEVNKLLEPAN